MPNMSISEQVFFQKSNSPKILRFLLPIVLALSGCTNNDKEDSSSEPFDCRIISQQYNTDLRVFFFKLIYNGEPSDWVLEIKGEGIYRIADITNGRQSDLTLQGNRITDWNNGEEKSFSVEFPLQKPSEITLVNGQLKVNCIEP